MSRQPDPHDLRGHFTLPAPFNPGGAFVNATPVKARVPFAGAVRGRIRILTAAGGGTLSSKWLRPDGETPYAANNPADVAVVAGVENKLDIDPNFGEGILELTFTPAANGSFTYVDVSQV